MQHDRFNHQCLAATLLALAIGTSNVSTAHAGMASLRESLRGLAKEIVDVVVKDQNQSAIAVGDFLGPADVNANAGPGVTETLKSLLEEIQPGIVQRKASLSLRGSYDKVADPRDSHLMLIKIAAEIKDRNARRIDEKFAELRDTAVIAGMLGASVSLPAAATREKRNEVLQQAIEKPQFSYAPGDGSNTRISGKRGSPFGIEILVAPVDRAPKDARGWEHMPARAPRNENGEAFVDIKRNEVYAIRLHNDFVHSAQKYEAGVAVSIDGIDVFTFSEVRNPRSYRPKYTHYVVPYGRSIVPGWHKTNRRSDSFLVTEYGKGAVSKLPNVSRGKVGVITVQFALAWTGKSTPEAEAATHDAGNETGFGPPTRTQLKEVARQIGVIRDIISVRYTR